MVAAVGLEVPQVAIVLVEGMVVEEVVFKSPDSSVEQFRPNSARLSRNVREVLFTQTVEVERYKGPSLLSFLLLSSNIFNEDLSRPSVGM